MVVDHPDVFLALVGEDCFLGDHQRGGGFANGQADPGEHAPQTETIGVGENASHADRAFIWINAIIKLRHRSFVRETLFVGKTHQERAALSSHPTCRQ